MQRNQVFNCGLYGFFFFFFGVNGGLSPLIGYFRLKLHLFIGSKGSATLLLNLLCVLQITDGSAIGLPFCRNLLFLKVTNLCLSVLTHITTLTEVCFPSEITFSGNLIYISRSLSKPCLVALNHQFPCSSPTFDIFYFLSELLSGNIMCPGLSQILRLYIYLLSLWLQL